MDQIKIGKFIANMRKKQGLSQKQLAERIGVTDKTISKWETGYRMPDASILLELSLALQVDVNELLAGEEFSSEEFSSEEYVKKSESNIVNLVGELNEIDEKRRSRGIGVVVGILFIGLCLFDLFGSSLQMGSVVDIFDLPTLFWLFGLKFIIILISGWFHDYLNAWRACLPGSGLSEEEMKSSIQAMKYAGALSLALGGLISSISIFSLSNYIEFFDLNFIGSALAQIVLALFYTAIIETVYVILVFRMKRVIHRRRKNG